jgi:hypothetical protein
VTLWAALCYRQVGAAAEHAGDGLSLEAYFWRTNESGHFVTAGRHVLSRKRDEPAWPERVNSDNWLEVKGSAGRAGSPQTLCLHTTELCGSTPDSCAWGFEENNGEISPAGGR